MDVTYWLADAITGDLVREVQLPLVDPVFTRRLPGGTFSATIPTGALLDDQYQFDYDWCARLLEVIEPGTHSICPVVNGVSIGEWLIWRIEPDDVSGRIEISGFEWGLYPRYRALERDYVYTNRDQALVAYDLLVDCIRGSQPVKMFVPLTNHGVTVSMDQRRKTAYYGDVLEEQVPNLEWFVWSRLDDVNAPTRVVRDVIMSNGRRKQVQPSRLIAPSPGSPGGSLISWRRARDWSKAAASVYGFGRGQGDKQITAERVVTALLDGKHLITTRYDTWSEIEDRATLQSRVDTEAALGADPSEAVRARVNLDDFASYPMVTDVFTVVLDPRPTYPAGHVGQWRVGETTIRPTGDRVVIDLLMEPA